MTYLAYLRARNKMNRSKKMELGDFEEPTPGDRFIPKDNLDHVVVVLALEHRTGVVTANSPNGTDAIAADVLDLDAPDGPAVYKDTLLFGGAFVDAFKRYIGSAPRAVKIAQRKSNSGRLYAVPIEATGEDIARAKKAFENGNPFAPEIESISEPAKAPF